MKISIALNAYLKSRQTKSAAATAVRSFIEIIGDLPVIRIDRRKMIVFRDKLLSDGTLGAGIIGEQVKHLRAVCAHVGHSIGRLPKLTQTPTTKGSLQEIAEAYQRNSAPSEAAYVTAVGHFSTMLGREATPADLSRPNLAQFVLWLSKQEYKPLWSRMLALRLVRLWRVCHKQGKTTEAAPAVIPVVNRSMPGSVIWPKPVKLRGLEDAARWEGEAPENLPVSVAVQRVEQQVTKRVQKNLRYAARSFAAVMGDKPIRSIDYDTLDRFREQAALRGMTTRADLVVHGVRRIICLLLGDAAPEIHKPARPSLHENDPKELDGTLLSHYVLLYFPQRLEGRSDKSDLQYRINLRTFGRMLNRPATLADLTDETLAAAMERFANTPWQGRPRRARTINKLRTHVVAIWDFLYRKGIVKTGPTFRPRPEPFITPRAWTEEELSRLWKACREEPGVVGTVPAGDFWLALVRLGWDSAERISALLGILWSDISFSAGYANFRAEVRKGKVMPNLVKLSQDTIESLKTIRGRGLFNDPVLPWPLSVSSLYNHYSRILESAGLESSRETKFHCIRRSVASHGVNAGANATVLLRHSSAQVTAKYLDPRVVKQVHAADLLFRPDASTAIGGQS